MSKGVSSLMTPSCVRDKNSTPTVARAVVMSSGDSSTSSATGVTTMLGGGTIDPSLCSGPLSSSSLSAGCRYCNGEVGVDGTWSGCALSVMSYHPSPNFPLGMLKLGLVTYASSFQKMGCQSWFMNSIARA